MTPDGLVEHFFRHEYGRLVATLTRRAGLEHHQAAEDAVQAALAAAVDHWRAGAPDNPSAWLFRVAWNKLLNELGRASTRRARSLEDREIPDPQPEPPVLLAGEVADALLRMLFVCCHESIPGPSQLVLALHTLCGFSVPEIAQRLFISEANVYKRLSRARERLRSGDILLEPTPANLLERLPRVHHVLYALFAEGHLSSSAEASIRRDLCDEALRLGLLLADHPAGDDPATAALVALMLFHRARLDSRDGPTGDLVLLEDQDRTRWDAELIRDGLVWLERAARGSAYTRYHAEAAIAAEHCLAPDLASTRWDRVAESYALLERIAPSPLHRLNRAVAVAQLDGPEAGLAVLDGAIPPSWLAGSWMWSAVLADLHERCEHDAEAARHRRAALDLAPTVAVRNAMTARWSK